MRLTRILFVLSLLAVSSVSFGQGFVVYLYSLEQAITDSCGGGNPIPDGAAIKIFWDANGNGPDEADEQPVEGAGALECNFNQFTVNGGLAEFPGGFFTENGFSIETGVPASPSYYLKICMDSLGLHWVSDTFVVSAGYNERNFGPFGGDYVSLSCVEEPCGGCPTPAPVTNVTADTTSCVDVSVDWDHADNVTGYRIRVDSDPLQTYFVQGGANTQWLDTFSSYGTHSYVVRAYLVCDQDTALSSATMPVSGRRVQGPPVPQNMQASDTLCGTVQVTWTVNTVLGLDSFHVYRNDVHIGSLNRGTAGQLRTFNDNAPLAGPQNYCVYGWSDSCDLGVPACNLGQGGVTPGLSANIVATDDRCDSVVVTWTYTLGDAESFDVFRNSTSIASVPATGGPNYRYAHAPTAGQQGQYQIRAVNDCGVGALAPTTPEPGIRLAPPGLVQSIVASDTLCDGVNVIWAVMANIDSFQIRMNGGRIGVVAGDIEEYFDAAAVAGVTNTYTVVAYNDCGAGQVAAGNSGTRRAPGTGTASFAMTQAGPPNWTYSMTVTSGCLNRLVIRDYCEGTTATAPANWTVTVNSIDSIVFSSTEAYGADDVVTGFGLHHPTCDGDGRWGAGQSGGTIRGPLPVGSNAELPTEYALKVYPNPFNPQTTLHLAVPLSSETRVYVFNVTGQLVHDQNFGRLQAGYHSLRFDGADLPSGMYFARVQSGNFHSVQKLMLLK